jgi:hypothetical protein
MSVVLSLLINLCATAAILNIGRFAEQSAFSVCSMKYINRQLMFQVLLFGVALLVLGAVYFVNSPNLTLFFSPGTISAPAAQVWWLGIAEGESWITIGAGFGLIITLTTTAFIYLKFRKTGSSLFQIVPFIPWILLISFANAFSEELIYRIGVIVPLAGSIERAYIQLLSAVSFGIPHLCGMPNGLVGALMAGFLGWLLAKSVLETNGIFWAWSIHFFQDIVIFSAFVMTEVHDSINLPLGECVIPQQESAK